MPSGTRDLANAHRRARRRSARDAWTHRRRRAARLAASSRSIRRSDRIRCPLTTRRISCICTASRCRSNPNRSNERSRCWSGRYSSSRSSRPPGRRWASATTITGRTAPAEKRRDNGRLPRIAEQWSSTRSRSLPARSIVTYRAEAGDLEGAYREARQTGGAFRPERPGAFRARLRLSIRRPARRVATPLRAGARPRSPRSAAALLRLLLSVCREALACHGLSHAGRGLVFRSVGHCAL